MKHWQTIITQGNQAFDHKEFNLATALYQRATDLAELSLNQPDASDNQVMALLVSHFNLSDLYMELNQPEKARHQLQSLYEKLITIQNKENSEMLSLAVSRGLYKCHTQIMSFDKQQNTLIPTRTETLPDESVQHYLH